jgi:hypothetical protein
MKTRAGFQFLLNNRKSRFEIIAIISPWNNAKNRPSILLHIYRSMTEGKKKKTFQISHRVVANEIARFRLLRLQRSSSNRLDFGVLARKLIFKFLMILNIKQNTKRFNNKIYLVFMCTKRNISLTY